MNKPIAIDLYAGLGGWSDGLLAEGWHVIGFDIERHVYGDHAYPAQLVIQDVLTLHGSQFKAADLIVASPPCQEYSYMAMPWSRAKKIRQEYLSGERDKAKLTALFDACFRIQREACEAADRHIPMIVENVRGAQEWVGRAPGKFGSFYLWGDVPALMPMSGEIKHTKPFKDRGWTAGCAITLGLENYADIKGVPPKPTGHWTNTAENGTKIGGDWFSDPNSTCRKHGSKSNARKAASAMIAKIPLPLSRYIAKTFKP